MDSTTDCLVCVESLTAAWTVAEANGVAWCTAAERERMQAISAEPRRRQYLAGHWLARALASQQFGGTPAQWSWRTSDAGAPSLHHPGLVDAVAVSVSHSGDWIAAAVASTAIGIDLEFPRRPRPLRELAAFIFSPEENAALDPLPEEDFAGQFYLLWSLKEAHGKRLGTGLRPVQARRITALRCEADVAEALCWSLPERGNLALAARPGMRVELQGLANGITPSHWHFRDSRSG